MSYTLNSGRRVVNVIDHMTKRLTEEQFRQAFGNGQMMLESVTLEEIEATHLYDLDGNGYSTFMEAIITSKNRIERTMAAFARELNLAMNGSNLEAGAAEIGPPRKSGNLAIMAARFPLTDGQSISVIFHSPSGDPGKIATDDMLVAFRFLLNKRDVTHVVAPSGGRDISLKQTTLALSNLAERNSSKFQAQLDANKAKEEELATIQADTAQLQTQADDLSTKLDTLAEGVNADTTERDRVSGLLDAQKQRNDQLRQQLSGLQKPPAPTPDPTIDGATDKAVIPNAAKDELMTQANRPKDLGTTIPGVTISKTTARTIDLIYGGGSTLTRYTWDGTGYKSRGRYLLTDGRTIAAEDAQSADLKSAKVYDPVKANQLAAQLRAQDDDLYKKVINDMGSISGIDDGSLQGYDRALFVSSLTNALQSAAKKNPDNASLALQMIQEVQKQFAKPVLSDRHSVWKLMKTDAGTTDNQQPDATADATDPRRAEWDARLDGMTDLELMGLAESRGSVGAMSGDSLRQYLKSLSVEELDAAAAKLASDTATKNAKTLFWYGLRARPYSPAAQPAGAAEYVEPARVTADPRLTDLLANRDANDVRFGALAYAEKLPDDKVKAFELVDLTTPVWSTTTRQKALADLYSTVMDLLTNGERPANIWQDLFKPRGELVASNNPFYSQATGQYASDQMILAMQEAGYSGNVQSMVDAMVTAAQDEISKRSDYLPGRMSSDAAAAKSKELSDAAISLLQTFMKGNKAPAGWDMEVTANWATVSTMIGVSVTRPAIELKPSDSDDWIDGYIVAPSIEDERGVTNGDMDIYYGDGGILATGVVSVTTWDQLMKAIQDDQARQADKQNKDGKVGNTEPTTAPDATQTTSNQWDESDPKVLAALQTLEDLRKSETDIDTYMAKMEAAFTDIQNAGALDRHEPYMHTVADRLTELMEAEGV